MHRRGFTLLEMSIVLVTISFLVGGIIAGKSLIQAAKVRGIIEETQAYIGAVRLFHDKYIYLPGDMPNAESIWGQAAAGNACFSTVSTGPETCNGNGDGRIGSNTHSSEEYRAWQHMANAGVVAGSFTGVNPGGMGSYVSMAGVNVPPSRLPLGGYRLNWSPPTSGDTDPNFYNSDYGNTLVLQMSNATTSEFYMLKVDDAKTIDDKADDGFPSTGNVLSVKSTWTPNCTTSDVSGVAQYLVNGTGKPACGLLFLTGF